MKINKVKFTLNRWQREKVKEVIGFTGVDQEAVNKMIDTTRPEVLLHVAGFWIWKTYKVSIASKTEEETFEVSKKAFNYIEFYSETKKYHTILQIHDIKSEKNYKEKLVNENN